MANYLVSIKNKDRLGKIFLLISIGLAFLFTHSIIGSQYIQSGDSFWHYSNEFHLIKSIENGKGIFTCLYKGLGLPLSAFYQPLLYIIVAGVYFCSAKMLSVFFIHNLIVCLLFSLFPLSIYYFARSFRFSIFVSGLASLFSLVPISGWGHTIDAYFWIGLHTQLLGALFLPVVLGSIHRLTWSKHISRNLITAVLSAAALLMGHAVYAVLAGYAGLIYLALFLFQYGLRRTKNLLKPLLLITVCAGIIVSFWLVPFFKFNSEYKFIPESERSFSPLAVSLTVKDTLEALFSGTLLDTNNLDSPLFGGGEEGFRWSLNDQFHRFKLFTVLTLLGFIISLFMKKKFRYLFICFLMAGGLFLFCGKDDFPILHFLPFARNFQPIRAIFLIELSAMLLSATAIDWIFCFINRRKIPADIKYILLTLTVLLITPLLLERLHLSNIIIKSRITPAQNQLKSLYSKIEDKDELSRIYFGKYTGIQKISLRSIADCFFLNNAVGHDNDMAGSLSWLINDVQKDIPAYKEFSDLLGVKYMVKRNDWSFPEKQKQNIDKDFKSNDRSTDYELLSNVNQPDFYSFADKKPVLVYCDNTTWYYLNRLWIKLFLKNHGNISPLVKAPEFFPHLLNESILAGAVFINFPLKKSNKKIYHYKLKEFCSKGIKIFSNKPMWDIPVEKLIPSMTQNFTDFIVNTDTYNSNCSIKNSHTKFNAHTLNTYADTTRLITLKTAYYDNWTTFIDGKKLDTLWVSPGFAGSFVPKGSHELKFEYIPSQSHALLLIFAILSMTALYILIRKTNISFKNEPLIIIFHFHILKYLKLFSRAILLIMIIILALGYINTKIFQSVTLIYPYNKTKGINPYEIVFRWNKINKDETYFFQLAESKNSFDNPLFQIDTLKETSVGYRGLKPYKTYYWRLKTNGSWSDVYSFKTGNYFPVVIPD